MKQCKRCKDLGVGLKSDSEFNKGSDADGLQSLCRKHSNEASRAWAKANPEKHRAKTKKHRDANPIAHRQVATRNRLKRTYGLSEEQYVALLEKQSCKCALCALPLISLLDETREFLGQPPNNIARVDHCHKTGRVRGLLCFGCNVGLGKFRDDEQLMLKAIGYLRSHATQSAQPAAAREAASEIEPAMGPRIERSRGTRRDSLSPFFD